MKTILSTIFCILTLALLFEPAMACTGCSGRFPPGVNLRLLRMQMRRDLDQRDRVPPSKGQAIPMAAPSKSAKGPKAKPKAGKKTKAKPAQKSSKP